MDLTFKGGSIFNREHYPHDIMVQALPVMKKMGGNLDVKYAVVDTAGAERDLSAIGYRMRTASHTESMGTVDPSAVSDNISALLRSLFEEDISVERGPDRILVLMSCAIEGLVAETKDNFFASSTRSEGKYFSYQMAFYSMRRASYCFLVLSLIAFKEQSSVFGIPTGIRSGISHKIQVFKCKRVHPTVIYKQGRLHSGESMESPNGKHSAALRTDGNFAVDGRWESLSAGKGVGPWYLVLQDDANLVIYDARDQPTWASGSNPGKFGMPPWRLELQDGGNLVIYDKNNRFLWGIGI
ncbi:hypothetical protein BC628DRAFT_203453 [Trametes gibbosa]|nr:hypothetical protein BC628DRAFT_203453 [Trametes gibbosa]